MAEWIFFKLYGTLMCAGFGLALWRDRKKGRKAAEWREQVLQEMPGTDLRCLYKPALSDTIQCGEIMMVKGETAEVIINLGGELLQVPLERVCPLE